MLLMYHYVYEFFNFVENAPKGTCFFFPLTAERAEFNAETLGGFNA